MTDTLVLCYHAVSPAWEADLSVRPDGFERQLSALLARGYRPATFTAAATGRQSGRTVVVTFDDAFESVARLARPVLDRLGVPATVFVPTDYAGTDRPIGWKGVGQWVGGEHHGELECMSWDTLRDLRDSGWEIGSHTCSHPFLTELDDDRLARELGESRARCEAELGELCSSIAYPYGDVDERVVAATRAAGYTAGAELGERSYRNAALRVPRVGVYHGDDARRFAVKVSRPVRMARETRLWGAVEIARSRARGR